MNRNPLTVTRAELEQSFDLNIKPLYDMNAGFEFRGIVFDNQHWAFINSAITYNNVKIYVNMKATIQEDVRRAFRAYLLPLMDRREGVTCMLNYYNQHIKLSLGFENDTKDGFQHNPYVNQNAILALQVLREKCATLQN